MIRADRIPAVAYYRMSSKKQDKSIKGQRVEVEQYAERHGYRILRWEPYVDEGISGSESEKRDGFQRLMRDATERGDFRVILCWDQDRFSRFDPLEANHHWFLLRQAGVRIVTVRQGELDLSELGGWLVASINQHGKAQYLKDLSANVLRGRLRKAEQGLWAGSRAPYGYALTKDSRLILGDRDHVQTVRWIFKTYADQDISIRQLAAALNDKGAPTPAGGLWTGSKVRAILKRDAYLGQAAQFRESKGKFHTIAGRSVAPANGNSVKPEVEWFKVDCPTIIDRKLWNRCAAKLVGRRTKTTPTLTGKGLLNGLLYCGHCGARMYAASRPLDSSGGMIYCCSTYNVHGTKHKAHEPGCHRNLVHQDQLVPFLTDKIQELLLAPENLDRLRAAIGRQLATGKTDTEGEQGRLRSKLAKLDRDIKAAARELKRTPDDLYELAVDDLRQLRKDRDRAATALEAAEASVEQPKASTAKRAEQAIAAIQRLGKAVTSTNPAVAREALSESVERIDLWFDHKQSAKMTRSYFRRGIVRFRKPASLLGPASRPG